MALAVLASAAALLGCNGAARAGEPAPLQGVVEYDDRLIGFELGGRVLEVTVERGSTLVAGAPLARLDDALERPLRELRAAELEAAQAQLRLLKAGARGEELRASQAEIDALRAQEETLGRSVERQRKLQAAGAAPEATIDALSAELRGTSERRRALEQRLKALRSGARSDEIAAAVARAEAATASLALVEARLERYALFSPIAATVVDVHVKAGEMVAPGTPAITVADLAHPYVDVFVPQGRLDGVRLGARTDVRVDAVPKPLSGRVEHVFPQTEFTPRFLFSEGERPNLVVRVRVRIDDPGHVLHSGLPAFVRVGHDASVRTP